MLRTPNPKYSQPGEAHPRAKLTEAQVREIRQRVAALPYGGIKVVARQFNMSATHVSDICSRQRWKHLA